MSLYSTPVQLAQLRRLLLASLRLPFFQQALPGRLLEEALAHVRSGTVLPTYDFVDVISPEDAVGWQVKSTRAATPVTWKRAKLPNATTLIDASVDSEDACQELGDTIIAFCNEHARESLTTYDLNEIGYARLIVHPRGRATYLERFLCSKSQPQIFNPQDFKWTWSSRKAPGKKEQLPALHGIHQETNARWWAWHGLGENQLHFTGEPMWRMDGSQSISFSLPTDRQRLTYGDLLMILERNDSDR